MTFREKLAKEHPECVGDKYDGGCEGCPYVYGYEEESSCNYYRSCTECWDREMEEEKMASVDELKNNFEEAKRMSEPLLSEVLQFGQGDDDCVFEAFKGIYYLQKGYYTLINYGDEWWKDTLNQDVWCGQMIEEEWNKIDWDEFEGAIDKIFKVMCGSYIHEDKFYNALEKLNELGIGFRPQRKEKEQKNE